MENKINRFSSSVKILSIIGAFGYSGAVVAVLNRAYAILTRIITSRVSNALQFAYGFTLDEFDRTKDFGRISNLIMIITMIILFLYLFFAKKNRDLAKNNPKKLLKLLEKEQAMLIVLISIEIILVIMTLNS